VIRASASILAAALLFGSLNGCFDHRAATNTDSWYKVPADFSRTRESQPVQWAEVKPSLSVSAEQRLARADIVRVSRDEAHDYSSAPSQFSASNDCYIVRALYMNRGTGSFSVRFDGRDLYVHHSSMGHHAVPMKRQPLLVALPAAPEHVYVTVSMAE
jgi:hypothetical protein